MHPNDFDRNHIRIQTSAVSGAAHLAMTINKALEQSPQVWVLNLENPYFSHGQLYVAFSRVEKLSDLFVYTLEGKIKNIVYPKAFQ